MRVKLIGYTLLLGIVFVWLWSVSATLVFAEQVVWVDESGTWPSGNLQKKGPANLVAPIDYKEGYVYVRYEVTSKPTSERVSAQLCMWQDSFAKESCSFGMDILDEGVYYRRIPPLNVWWNKSPIDFTRGYQRFSLIHKIFDHNGTWLDACSGSHCMGANARTHIPITYNVTVILTTKEHEFIPPSNWSNCPQEWGCAAGGAQSDPAFPVYGTGRLCNSLQVGSSIPTGFGAPYDVVFGTNKVLLNAYCVKNGINAVIGDLKNTTLIYQKGYQWKGSKWEEFLLGPNAVNVGGTMVPHSVLASEKVSDVWIVGKAEARLYSTEQETKDGVVFVVYTCQWNGSAWKCGCRDLACTTPLWQVQRYKLQ